MSRVRLGDMLVAAGMVGAEQISAALERQQESKRRLGETLVELGAVSELQLAQVLSNQLSIPWANLYHVDFSRELLSLVPAEIAETYNIVPVYVRRVRKQGDTLFVATDDPTNEHALIAIANHAQMPVKPMVAAASDVRNAIRVYYFGGTLPAHAAPAPRPSMRPESIAPIELEDLDLEDDPSGPVILIEPDADEDEGASAAATSEAEVAPAPEQDAATPPAAEAPAAQPRRRKKPAGKFVTLTLLDGTSVRLPAPTQKETQETESSEHALTTRDLVSALVARSQGKDVSAVLTDGRWEPLFAALLSLLMRKGLIADWEFVEEWNKHRAAAGSS